jgi:hypothetical protein
VQNNRKEISTLLYYMLLSSLTSIVFIVAGLVLFALSSLRITDPIGIVIISALLVWKGALVGFVTWSFHKKSHNQEFAVKFIGLYLGRFYGTFIGGFLGARIAGMFRQADIFGFIVGALAFYFAGRWIGSTTSVTISGLLDKVFSITKTEEQEKVVEAKPLKRVFLVVYIVVLPLLLVVVALLLKYFSVPIGYLVE